MSGFQCLVGSPIPRVDAGDKVQGITRYMTDLHFPGQLAGRLVRAEIPHGKILRLDVSAARKLPGVHAVVTAADVPGRNGYGIAVADQPVFASEKVRFLGEPLAGIVADTDEIARKAEKLVVVEYAPLPVVSDPVKALSPDSALVDPAGNVHQETLVSYGDVDSVWAEAHLIVENTCQTSMQAPAYLEVEGGVGVREGDSVTIYCASQHPDSDRQAISEILNLSPDRVRIVGYPMGGAFGGRVDMTLQPHLAVMSYAVSRPVKLVNSREDSFQITWKRHPMIITMKTAVDRQGNLLANQVDILSDTGAYAGMGGAVANLALESSCGAYRVPNTRLRARAVLTNNSLSSAMRGFGVPQVTFAMETQMEILAEKLGMDPLELRLRNALKTGDTGALGHTLTHTMGVVPTLEKVGETDLWVNREQYKKTENPWRIRGVGMAVSIQGLGLGVGLPDDSITGVRLLPDGSFQLCIGCPDLGQGSITALMQIMAEALGIPVDRIRTHCGDTGCTPDSGPSVASRTVYASGNSILRAVSGLQETICQELHNLNPRENGIWQPVPGGVRGPGGFLSFPEIARKLDSAGITAEAQGKFSVPTADKAVEGAFGLPHLLYSTVAHVALVEVDRITGAVHVLKAVCIPDAGTVINSQGLEAQAEGGTVMGMGYATMEEVLLQEGRVITRNYNTYLIPTAKDAPEIFTDPVIVPEPSGPFGAKGIGECVGNPITPAITNAVHDAVGLRVLRIPVSPEEILLALESRTGGAQ